ncbi:hypothetical protein LWI28_003025 [Acer negundo]|uniref:Two-component response regulator n=1 Tax=Acer negundo TaxID=4023 RepID=A0AAD5IKB6_ACENE|nr:hypothetical protein LWI28_003025 [Acer negundo]
MMENGFSSPRNDTFPAGLRVLVVDDDPTWLKILEKMLKKCSYEVTTCGLARDALCLLREKKDGYDIVISDVNMPDMDGFKLLEHVGLEMDLPVIMMSVDGETSRVMKGVQHGACDYLLKPIRMKELRNIWQHVFRKRIHEVRDIESLEGFESIQIPRYGSDQSDDGYLFTGEDPSMRKRKDCEGKYDERDCGDPSSSKKARVVWSVDLHQKFVQAVNQIGFDKVGPKRILDLMNVPWLTRENVASHLQKYRLYLSRLQKDDNELTTSAGGIKHTDSSKDSAGGFGLQNSMNIHHNDVSTGSYGFSGSKSFVQNLNPKSLDCEKKGIVSEPITEPKRALIVDIPNPCKVRSSQIGFESSFASLGGSQVDFTAFGSTTIPTRYSWSDVPEVLFRHESKSTELEDGFSQLPPSRSQHHIQADHIKPVPSISSSSSAADRSNHANHATSTESAIDPLPVQTKNHISITNHQAFDPLSTTALSMKSQGFNLSCISDLESTQRNISSGIETLLPSLDEDLKFCWLQGDYLAMNLGLQDFPEYYDPGIVSEVPIHLYDALRHDYDNPCDPTEYPLIEQGLFIV